MSKVVLHGDQAIGHTDVQGNPVTGTVVASSKIRESGKAFAVHGDIVHFPSHPHQMVEGSPADFQEHNIPLTGTGKLSVNGSSIVIGNHTISVADVAGPDATLTASSVITDSV